MLEPKKFFITILYPDHEDNPHVLRRNIFLRPKHPKRNDEETKNYC